MGTNVEEETIALQNGKPNLDMTLSQGTQTTNAKAGYPHARFLSLSL